MELIGLCALCVILLAGCVVVFFNSIHRLPAGDDRLKAGDFPVEGRHLVILSAETYWRPPIREGKNAETFRRGTQLLPVVELTSSGGPAAVRVFFRDQDGLVTGDAVTRAIQPASRSRSPPPRASRMSGCTLPTAPARASRGPSRCWKPRPATSANAEFKKLFEINISTDRR